MACGQWGSIRLTSKALLSGMTEGEWRKQMGNDKTDEEKNKSGQDPQESVTHPVTSSEVWSTGDILIPTGIGTTGFMSGLTVDGVSLDPCRVYLPSASSYAASPSVYLDRDYKLDELTQQIDNLRSSIAKLKHEAKTSQAIRERLEQLESSADRLLEQGQDLSAKVIVPPLEELAVYLAPYHLLDRLEEYRSDEMVAHLLIGLFGGGFLGLIPDLVTDLMSSGPSIITPTQVVLAVMLGLLTGGAIFWATRLRKRADSVRERMPRVSMAKRILEPSQLPKASSRPEGSSASPS